MSRAPSALCAFLLSLVITGCAQPQVVPKPPDTPELSFIDQILEGEADPAGVLFVIFPDHEEHAWRARRTLQACSS